jgi:HAD superfamily hydrolase (TIGR01459 family)
MTVPLIDGLAELSAAYDGYILDVWGVMHQGGPAYDEAVDCLRALDAAGKRVIFLSNAPRRAAKVAEVLAEKGIARALYDDVLSSGEATRIAFEQGDEPALDGLGRRYFLFSAASDDDLLDGLDFAPAATVGEADFLLAIGLSDARPSLAAHEADLQAAAGRGLPMVCVNPDLEVVRLGNRELCAGALAARYEALGGPVIYFGKPHAQVYRLSLERLGIAERGRVLAIGDGLATDIKGAQAAGIDSLLVTGGLLAEMLGVDRQEAPRPEAVAAVCREADVRPRAAIPALCW